MITVEQPYIETLAAQITESQEPTLVMSIGLPGSGKSTILRRVGDELNVPVISADTLHAELNTHRPHGFSMPYFHQFVRDKIAEELDSSGVALLDDTNCFRATRMHDLKWYRKAGAKTIGGLWVDMPLDKALAFDAARTYPLGAGTVQHTHVALTEYPPRLDDGFDWLKRPPQS